MPRDFNGNLILPAVGKCSWCSDPLQTAYPRRRWVVGHSLVYLCRQCDGDYQEYSEQCDARWQYKKHLYNLAHRDERAAYNRRYREAFAERIKERDRVYREKNRVRIAAQRREYRAAHAQEIAEKKRIYATENRVQINQRKAAWARAKRATFARLAAQTARQNP